MRTQLGGQQIVLVNAVIAAAENAVSGGCGAGGDDSEWLPERDSG